MEMDEDQGPRMTSAFHVEADAAAVSARSPLGRVLRRDAVMQAPNRCSARRWGLVFGVPANGPKSAQGMHVKKELAERLEPRLVIGRPIFRAAHLVVLNPDRSNARQLVRL
jgi:hypothetical protein